MSNYGGARQNAGKRKKKGLSFGVHQQIDPSTSTEKKKRRSAKKKWRIGKNQDQGKISKKPRILDVLFREKLLYKKKQRA